MVVSVCCAWLLVCDGAVLPCTHNHNYADGLNVITAQGYVQEYIRQMFPKRASWARLSLPDMQKGHRSPPKRNFGTEIPNRQHVTKRGQNIEKMKFHACFLRLKGMKLARFDLY